MRHAHRMLVCLLCTVHVAALPSELIKSPHSGRALQCLRVRSIKSIRLSRHWSERTNAEATVGHGDDEHADVAALRAGALVRLQLADNHAERHAAGTSEVAQLRPLL